MADNDVDVAGILGAHAAGNVAAGHGVAPQAAVDAIHSAPLSGIPPQTGMHDAPFGIGLAQQATNSATLRASPPLTSFVASDPAKATAVGDDYTHLANVGWLAQRWKDFARPFNENWRQVGAAWDALKAGASDPALQGKENPFALLPRTPTPAEGAFLRTVDAPSPLNTLLATSGATGLANLFTAPAARGIVGVTGPGAGQTREEATQQVNLGLNMLAGIVGPMALAAAGRVKVYPKLPDVNEGMFAREQPKLAGPSEPIVDAEFTAPQPPGLHPESDAFHAAQAEWDAGHETNLQNALAQSKTLTRSPQLTQDFLENHTALGDDTVRVPADAITKLWSEGHNLFADKAGEVGDALETGGDVAISHGQYTTEVAGKPFAEGLNGAARFNGAVSQEEAKGIGGESAPPTEHPVTLPEDIGPEHAAGMRTLAANADQAISQVFKETALDQLFETPRAAGLTKPQMEAWSARLEEAQVAAHDKLLQRTYTQIRYERTEKWRGEVVQHLAASEQDLAKVPGLNAYSALMRGKGALGEPLEHPTKFASDDPLSKHARDVGLPAQMFAKGGLTPDQLAEELGFPSGADLIRSLELTHTDAQAAGKGNFADYMKALVKQEAEGRTRKALGYDVSRQGMLNAAREAVSLPQVESLLSDQLRELADNANIPFSKENLEAKAAELFQRLPIKSALNLPEMVRTMWKMGNKVEGLIEKDPVAAFKAKQAQLLNLYQVKMARDLAKQFARDNALLTRWAQADTIPGIDPTVGAIIQKNVEALNYTLGRDAGELDRFIEQSQVKTNADLIGLMNDEGYPVLERSAVPAVGEKMHAGKLPPSIAVRDFTEFMNMLKGMAAYGKEVGQITAGAKSWALTDIATETQLNADRLGEKFTPQELFDNRKTAFSRLKNDVKTLLVNNLRPEVYLHWVDGSTQGKLMQSVVNPLMDGKYTEADLIDGWVKAMNSATDERSFHSTMGERLSVPDHMQVQTVKGPVQVVKTRGNLRVALLHLGSDTARAKLLDGFGWGDVQEKWLKANATAQDWEFAKAFWAQNEKLFQLADGMYMRVRGYGLPKDPARNVDTEGHGTVGGGHVRIRYDPTLNDMRRVSIAQEGIAGQQGNVHAERDVGSTVPARALPSALYGIERTGYVGPVDLEPLTLSSGVAEMVHDIAFREPMIAAQKVLTDARVGNALARVLGPEYEKQMMPWLNYIAKERLLYDPATDDTARLIRNVSSNFVWSKVAFRLSSALKHGGVGLSHMTTEVGSAKALARATSDLIGSGPKAQGWQNFVRENFGEVRTTAWNTDTNLRDALSRDAWGTNNLSNYRKLGYSLFTASKYAEASVTALAKYRMGMADHGIHEQAVAEANKAVRDTQGAGSAVDTPPMLRRGGTGVEEFGRMAMGLLMGFRNTTTNREFTMKRQVGQVVRKLQAGDTSGAAEDAGTVGGSALGFGILPAAWITAFTLFIAGRYDEKKDLAENLEHEFFWNTIDQGLGGIIGASQLVGAARYAKNKASADNPLTSMEADAANVLNVSDPHWWAHTASAVGEVTGLIPQTAVDVAQALGDDASGFGGSGQLKPTEQGVIPFVQRAALGRKPQYERREKGSSGGQIQ